MYNYGIYLAMTITVKKDSWTKNLSVVWMGGEILGDKE